MTCILKYLGKHALMSAISFEIHQKMDGDMDAYETASGYTRGHCLKTFITKCCKKNMESLPSLNSRTLYPPPCFPL